MKATSPPLGLIAGAGGLPRVAARALAREGRSVVAVGFEGLAEHALEAEVAGFRWIRLGQLESLAVALRELSVSRVLLVGKVPKTLLFAHPGAGEGAGIVELDDEARRLLAALDLRGDDALMAAVAEWLDARGFELCDQAAVLDALKMPLGSITRAIPDARAKADLAAGLPSLRALGRVGVGQCVVVKDGAVVAVEAVEGTDETIRRAGRLVGGGTTVIKAARPHQDRRIDLPVVGPDTRSALAEAGAGTLALEAGAVLLLEREVLVATADELGIAIWGFEPAEDET
ncbi:MAG: UDP-2,3-diacylglucosamine diphosphatase LpxI [Deltaproteobacteria bacterium]|jgi:DUF1009 family protein|nr:UDP-2,3-diacylglucosamine diphosphatase LpxI [Deltaproteobacteria bacterium]